MLLMFQHMELVRTIILIGKIENHYIKSVLQSSINIFALLFLPDKYVPEVSGKFPLERIKTSEVY